MKIFASILFNSKAVASGFLILLLAVTVQVSYGQTSDAGGVENKQVTVTSLSDERSDQQTPCSPNLISGTSSIALESEGVNHPPNPPVLIYPLSGARTSIIPTLRTDSYSDPDGDQHTATTYQISTTDDFSSLVLEYTTGIYLTDLSIFELSLDPDTVYYWRAKFQDIRTGQSQWSDTGTFITMDYVDVGDSDGNGVLDHQEMDDSVDLNQNGIADIDESGMLGVTTLDDFNPHVVVQSQDPQIHVAAVQAIETNQLSLSTNQTGGITGLISFKLLLPKGIKSATVSILFSKAAPQDAQWYKYDPEEGWHIYPNATFSDDRCSIDILLEDGGIGDLDGVENGIIVDPSGLVFAAQAEDLSTPVSDYPAEEGDGGSGCFICGVWHEDLSNLQVGIEILMLLAFALIMWNIRMKKKECR